MSTLRAHAGLMPRRALGWPLVAVLGVHLLLAWWWLAATGMRALPSIAPGLRQFLMVPVLLPPAPAAAPAPTVRAPARSIPRAAAPALREPEAVAAPMAEPVLAEPSSDPVGERSPQPGAAAVDDGSLAERARRAAGSADHALRAGKLAPPGPADTPWARFAGTVEGARKDSALTLKSESYTAPDGTVVYRFRKNGRYYCRTGGSVRPSVFGAEGGGATLFDKGGGGGSAGLITCPSQAEFTPD